MRLFFCVLLALVCKRAQSWRKYVVKFPSWEGARWIV